MPKQSAGILLYRNHLSTIQVFLAHPGGPFFKNKDLGSWTIPKGEMLADENPLDAAIREFKEETGMVLTGDFVKLTPVSLKGGKIVHAWALKGDADPLTIFSNTFELEWPPRSGEMKTFPEIDRCEWFDLDIARQKINEKQISFLNELQNWVATS